MNGKESNQYMVKIQLMCLISFMDFQNWFCCRSKLQEKWFQFFKAKLSKPVLSSKTRFKTWVLLPKIYFPSWCSNAKQRFSTERCKLWPIVLRFPSTQRKNFKLLVCLSKDDHMVEISNSIAYFLNFLFLILLCCY